MAKTTDKIRAFRELLNLIMTVIDAYFEAVESTRQLICWYEVLTKRKVFR